MTAPVLRAASLGSLWSHGVDGHLNRGAYFRPTEKHQLCLTCPLPDCDEADPRCRYKRHIRRPRVKPGEEWLSTRQVADALGVKVDTVLKHIYAGKIRARKQAGRWWVPGSEIEGGKDK